KLLAPAGEQYTPWSFTLIQTQPVLWSTTTPDRPLALANSVATGCHFGASAAGWACNFSRSVLGAAASRAAGWGCPSCLAPAGLGPTAESGSMPTPLPRRARVRKTKVAILRLVRNMAFSTPSVRAATLAEAAVATVFPAATPAVASTVGATSAGAGAAEAMQSENSTADSAAGQTTHRPFRRSPKTARASANRRRSVLLLQANWPAASSCVRPSR